MEGAGPIGLVRRDGRLATLTIGQRGQALTVTVCSGARRYTGRGTLDPSAATMTLSWPMLGAGAIRVTGALQRGGRRLIGLWSDTRGDDGGMVLVRVGR